MVRFKAIQGITFQFYVVLTSVVHMYTMSVVPVDTEISDVMEGASIWIPERADPIYKFDEKESSCKDSEVLQALSFLNVTCPIKSGRKLRIMSVVRTIE